MLARPVLPRDLLINLLIKEKRKERNEMNGRIRAEISVRPGIL